MDLSDYKSLAQKIPLPIAVLALYAFMAWSLGVVPTNAFGEGFARAEETKYNTQLILEQQLLSAKQSQCRASTAEAASFWTQKVIDLKNAYLDRLGRKYDEPSCEVLTPGD